MKNMPGLRRRFAMHLYDRVETAVGEFWLACGPHGVTMVHSAETEPAAFEAAYERRMGVKPERAKIPAPYVRALRDAAAGRPFGAVPIDLAGLPKFQRKVLTVLRRVPRGEVRTYAWLARKAGSPKAARAAGNAMARNPIPILVPCHRVVPAAGGIGNFGLGVPMKRALLKNEGAPVADL